MKDTAMYNTMYICETCKDSYKLKDGVDEYFCSNKCRNQWLNWEWYNSSHDEDLIDQYHCHKCGRAIEDCKCPILPF